MELSICRQWFRELSNQCCLLLEQKIFLNITFNLLFLIPFKDRTKQNTSLFLLPFNLYPHPSTSKNVCLFNMLFLAPSLVLTQILSLSLHDDSSQGNLANYKGSYWDSTVSITHSHLYHLPLLTCTSVLLSTYLSPLSNSPLLSLYP